MPSTHLQALAWALPTVLVLAVIIVFVLRRVLPRSENDIRSQASRMSTTTLVLSESAKAHVVTIDDRRYLVVEASQPTSVLPIEPEQPVPPVAKIFKMYK